MWERRVMEERTSEIYKRIQKKKMEAVKEAEEAEHKHEQLWREQGEFSLNLFVSYSSSFHIKIIL